MSVFSAARNSLGGGQRPRGEPGRRGAVWVHETGRPAGSRAARAPGRKDPKRLVRRAVRALRCTEHSSGDRNTNQAQAAGQREHRADGVEPERSVTAMAVTEVAGEPAQAGTAGPARVVDVSCNLR